MESQGLHLKGYQQEDNEHLRNASFRIRVQYVAVPERGIRERKTQQTIINAEGSTARSKKEKNNHLTYARVAMRN